MLAGCLRNGQALSEFIHRQYPSAAVTVIACGKQWPSGMLRPAIEDFIGAGTILSQFYPAELSSEAKMAAGAMSRWLLTSLRLLPNAHRGVSWLLRAFRRTGRIAKCGESAVCSGTYGGENALGAIGVERLKPSGVRHARIVQWLYLVRCRGARRV